MSSWPIRNHASKRVGSPATSCDCARDAIVRVRER
jgi:hypothetical protein